MISHLALGHAAARLRALPVRVLTLLAVILLALAAVRWRAGVLPELPTPLRDPDSPPYADLDPLIASRMDGLWLALGGIAGFVAALAVASGLPSLRVRPLPWTSAARRGWPVPLLAGGVLLALVARANGIRPYYAESMDSDLQFVLLAAGFALVIWGMAGMPWRLRLPSGSVLGALRRIDRALAAEVVVVLLITGVGLYTRLWGLNQTMRVWVDELNFSEAVRSFWDRDDVRLLSPVSGIVAFPRLYPYLQNHAIAVAGRTLAALRIPSAFFGALTIPALYLLARTLFDRTTGLVAALLLASYPVHVHFSRLGLNNIADPLFGTLAFAFLARAQRSGLRRDYALAGGALGLTQYFYEGGRLFFPVLLVGWLVAGWIVDRQRPHWRGLLAMVITAAVIAAPVYYTLVRLDIPLTSRLKSVGFGLEYWEQMARHRFIVPDSETPSLEGQVHLVRDHFLTLVQLPEASVYYRGDTPLVLVYLVPFLLLGVVFGLLRGGQAGLLPALWVIAAPLANSLLPGPPNTPRYTVAYPGLMLACAVGLRYTARLLLSDLHLPVIRLTLGAGIGHRVAQVGLVAHGQRVGLRLVAAWHGRRWRVAPGVPLLDHRLILAAVALGIAALQWWYYFGPHLDRLNVQIRASTAFPDGEDAILRSADFPPGTHVYLISDPPFGAGYAQGCANFVADRLIVHDVYPAEVTPGWLAARSPRENHAFFVDFNSDEVLFLLYDYYPLGVPELSPNEDVPLREQYVLFFVPRLAE